MSIGNAHLCEVSDKHEVRLGTSLKRAREAAGLEQTDVAEQLGIAVSTLSRWENGAPVKSSQLARLAQLYGMTFSELMASMTLRQISESRGTYSTWSPNPSLIGKIAQRVYDAAIGYCRRLAAAGLPAEDVEEAERLLIEPIYAKLAKRKTEFTEADQIEMLDATWKAISTSLSWRGIRA